MAAVRIALIGDYDAAATAHRAIPRALAAAADATGCTCEWEWRHTARLTGDLARKLSAFDGIWCVPASPYANTEGALAAIRIARESGVPFLGTCGGFQHALLEYARNVWGVAGAAHAELDPDAVDPVIAPLACSLVEQSGEIVFTPGTRLAAIYGAPSAVEAYHCRYGLNPKYSRVPGPLTIAARDGAGDPRAIELAGPSFFIATLFQPERVALAGRSHPLVNAFVAAARRG